MFRLFQWLRRYNETSAKPTDYIKALIAERKVEEKPCGVAYRVLANRSYERAAALGIDPPRPGRKTYGERYAETSAMSDSAIDALIAKREAAGKECGVLYRIKSKRG